MSSARSTGVSQRADLPLPRSVAHRPSSITSLDKWFAAQVQRGIADGPVRLELWDGQLAPGAPPHAIGDLVVRDRRALLGLAFNPDLYFGEAYTAGRIHVRGALTEVVTALSRSTAATQSRWERAADLLARANDTATARRNVHHHYDLGNDFYAMWLDREMVYTCAYYPDDAMTLEAAQQAKLDLVCRKLQLRAGETVVEAGCGWGALALHMARHYGVRVKAFNLSAEQMCWARDRARREGLESRVEFIEDDYRHVTGTCDVFVSVGMLEHVGKPFVRRTLEGHSEDREARRRPRPVAFHRTRRAPALERLDSPPDLSGRLHADARGGDQRDPRAGRNVGGRRREPAAALRAHAGSSGASALRPPPTACARCTARSSIAPGSSISPAPRPRSGPAGCSCSRSSSRRMDPRPRC